MDKGAKVPERRKGRKKGNGYCSTEKPTLAHLFPLGTPSSKESSNESSGVRLNRSGVQSGKVVEEERKERKKKKGNEDESSKENSAISHRRHCCTTPLTKIGHTNGTRRTSKHQATACWCCRLADWFLFSFFLLFFLDEHSNVITQRLPLAANRACPSVRTSQPHAAWRCAQRGGGLRRAQTCQMLQSI